MSRLLPVRPSGQARRRPGPRRASAGLSPRRAAAALVLVLAGAAGWGLTASDAFSVTNIQVQGIELTGGEEVAHALALFRPGPNAFLLATEPLRTRIRVLPTVDSVDVSVVLPDTLRVNVRERQPILAWRTVDRLLLIDRDGLVLADAAAPAASDAARTAAGNLPTVDDRRAASGLPDPGHTVDPLELEVATRLLSLRPADVGSAAPALIAAVDDADGWIVQPAGADPWTAVFGRYTTDLRHPDQLVPGQVRLLRSLLAPRERTVLRVMLSDGENGTYMSR